MQLDQLEAFVTIARVGTLTRAAATLHLSQPAVSRRLTLLERELGAPIFERVRAGVVLTTAGHAFMPFAESVLAGVRDGSARSAAPTRACGCCCAPPPAGA
jgi:DNA-binding transcriptional LysR family regulator